MSRRDRFGGHFPPSRPRAAKGGIRAQSQRGEFAKKWWGKRWIAVLESFQIGGRLQRGRTYARSGQVLAIEIEKGAVFARVQGSRPKPYEVRIRMKPLPRAVWRKMASALASQAVFATKLLAGEMPKEIDELLRRAGVPLFPRKAGDLQTSCTCPDWSNPCKHLAAVYYLLGEEFDRDPFLILKMRGMDRDEFLALMGERDGAGPDDAAVEEEEEEAEPLPVAPEEFWSMGALPEGLLQASGERVAHAALPRRLGKFPFWRGKEDFFAYMDGAYARAAARAEAAMTERE